MPPRDRADRAAALATTTRAPACARRVIARMHAPRTHRRLASAARGRIFRNC
jgi:hypothetical protein